MTIICEIVNVAEVLNITRTWIVVDGKIQRRHPLRVPHDKSIKHVSSYHRESKPPSFVQHRQPYPGDLRQALVREELCPLSLRLHYL